MINSSVPNLVAENSDGLIPPYGGKLKPLQWRPEEAQEILHRGRKWKRLPLNSRELGDLEMLRMGAFSPLTGFMRQDDWRGVCQDMRMTDGRFWPIPIVLSAKKEIARTLVPGEDIFLCEGESPVASLQVTDVYRPDKELEAKCVYGICDEKHPGVSALYGLDEYYVGGTVKALGARDLGKNLGRFCLFPAETRRQFKKLGWRLVTAFQTRNPMHRAHEYLTKLALETSDGLLLHSALGELKSGDIPAEVRMQAIETLLENYYVKETVINAGYPMNMRYAGPREALLHALFRQNYGCSHLIVGRDHAGVGSYYGPFEAQHIFSQVPKGALQIKPLNMDWTFWCKACDGMASARTCPHPESERLLLSGTKLRQLLKGGEEVPAHFSRPEVLQVLRGYYTRAS